MRLIDPKEEDILLGSQQVLSLGRSSKVSPMHFVCCSEFRKYIWDIFLCVPFDRV